MAPYPFHALDGWKALTGHIGQETLQRVLGEEWKVDGLTRVDGEIDEVHVPQRKESARVEELQEGSEAVERPKHQIEEEPLKFTLFDSKRSWQGGAVGEEVTRYSADKSWLLGDVLRRLDNGMSTMSQYSLAIADCCRSIQADRRATTRLCSRT